MIAYLILLFTVIPVVELIILIEVGRYVGIANTIALVILTGVSGAYLARMQGLSILSKIRNNLNNGIMPTEELIDAVMVLIGGLMLLTPGFVTDILGFMVLVPMARNVIKSFVKRKIIPRYIKKPNYIDVEVGP
ncbi:FxsA family protein [Elusimicrobiota bacterium]